MKYDVRGTDVSHHQGAIDWHAVADDGIDGFVDMNVYAGDRDEFEDLRLR